MTGLAFLTQPMLAYAAAAAGLILCAVLYVTLKQELRIVSVRHARQEKDFAAAIEEIRGVLSSLKTEMEILEKHSSTLVPPQAPRSGMNLSTRSQALRLHRRGESAEQISAELKIPRNEVDLLLKVHRIVIENL